MPKKLKITFCCSILLAATLLMSVPSWSGESVLLQKGPSPQPYVHETPPPDVREVRYPAAPGNMMAWFAMPKKPSAKNVPLLVYFHGGFSFGHEDFEVTRPFLDAGFAVITPTLRGENGNPGYFELLGGEVDDALAAIEWARNQPGVDPSRVYVFGHSIGGAISGLVAERPEAHLRLAGGAAGLYTLKTFDSKWAKAPFDTSNEDERKRRIYISNIDRMQLPFYFYLGTEDGYSLATASWIKSQTAADKFPFQIMPMPGDHQGMLSGAVNAFTKVILADAQPTPEK